MRWAETGGTAADITLIHTIPVCPKTNCHGLLDQKIGFPEKSVALPKQVHDGVLHHGVRSSTHVPSNNGSAYISLNARDTQMGQNW